MHILIAGNGQPPSKPLFRTLRNRCDLLIAADGGGNWCAEIGFKPDFVVGDLDSFYRDRHSDIPVIHDPDQETNDLEKALNLAIKHRAKHVYLTGVTGARLDQTLKNISVMVQFRDRFESLVMYDDMGWMMILPPVFSFDVEPGTTISLFPVSGKVDGIRTEGLEFALADESLENGVRDGSSNKSVMSSVNISHSNGHLLLMVLDGNKALIGGELH